MENLLEVRSLCKHYKSFSLDHVDLTVPAGTIVGLIGENGAGKTTTIKAALNVVRPDGGTIRLLGGDPADPRCRAGAAVVFEDSYFYGGLTPRQVSRSMAGICREWDGDAFDRLCRRFDLLQRQPLKEFSRGMRMKLSLATALARHPRLLVLDVATSGLDPVVRGEILDLFLEFIQDEGCGVLFSSHITTDLERVADQIAYLHRGRLLFQEDKDTLLEELGVLRCSAADMATLPEGTVLARRDGALGASALVRDPAQVRRLLPGAVVDRVSIDEMMQFYGGGEAK